MRVHQRIVIVAMSLVILIFAVPVVAADYHGALAPYLNQSPTVYLPGESTPIIMKLDAIEVDHIKLRYKADKGDLVVVYVQFSSISYVVARKRLGTNTEAIMVRVR
jgi:hypothetical protein